MRYKAEMERRCQFNAEHGAPGVIRAPPAPGVLGLRPFTARLRAVRWPTGFKIFGVDTYDGKANPAQWLTLYGIAVRAAGRIEDVMAERSLFGFGN